MALRHFAIKYTTLEDAYLVLVICTLLFFSDDGIVAYGSIPTYLILLGLFVKILKSPNYLVFAKFEQPFLLFLMCFALSVLFASGTAKLSHMQSYLPMVLTYLYARSIRVPEGGYRYLIWIFA